VALKGSVLVALKTRLKFNMHTHESIEAVADECLFLERWCIYESKDLKTLDMIQDGWMRLLV